LRGLRRCPRHTCRRLPVRDAYYRGFGDVDALFASWGLGWHVETGIQLLRLIFSGTFDRHPELQVIVGHWGELVLFFLERIEVADRMGLGLDRPIADYLRQNVSYTPSGIDSRRYLDWTIDVVGVERVICAADYPFLDAGEGGPARFSSRRRSASTTRRRSRTATGSDSRAAAPSGPPSVGKCAAMNGENVQSTRRVGSPSCCVRTRLGLKPITLTN
jgi:uncharacterized protein